MFTKGIGDTLTCGSYKGIKLVEHAMKVLERVIVREKLVKYCENWQYAVWLYGRKEHNRCNFQSSSVAGELLGKEEKSLDGFCGFREGYWVLTVFPVRCFWWASKCLGEDEWLVWAMYEDATTTDFSECDWERKQGLHCKSGSASGLSSQSIAVYHCIRGFV